MARPSIPRPRSEHRAARAAIEADPARQVVLSLQRGLEILRCFRPGDGSLSVPEIAARAGVPRQSANRFVYSLTQLGCLERRQADGRYQLGPRMLSVGQALLANLPIREAARPIMQRIANAHNTSVALGVAHDLDMIYIEYCVSPQTVTFRIRTGSVIPMPTTAMGRAYLWAIDDRRREVLFDRIKRAAGRQAAEIMAGIRRSFEELDEVGFCATFPSSRGDICGVGAPLVFNDGDTVLAFNCGVARLGLDERRFRDECGPALVRAVAEIKSAVGAVDAEFLGISESLSRP